MTREDAKRMVEECVEVAGEVFSEWEADFLESVEGQLEAGRTLSEKQEEIVERLYRKACDSPY